MAVTQYIGARYVPIFADPIEWTNTKQYEPLTIVTHEGNSYTSRQFVPVGIDISRDEYWALTGNYNAQVEAYRQEVSNLDGTVQRYKTDTDLLIEAYKTDTDSLIAGYHDEVNRYKEETIVSTDTVATLKELDGLLDGTIVRTGGYYSVGDGGAAYYIVDSELETFNDIDIIQGTNNKYILDTTLYGDVQNVNALTYGLRSGSANYGSLNSSIMNYLINLDFYKTIILPNGTYYFSTQITVSRQLNLIGFGSRESGLTTAHNSPVLIADFDGTLFLLEENASRSNFYGLFLLSNSVRVSVKNNYIKNNYNTIPYEFFNVTKTGSSSIAIDGYDAARMNVDNCLILGFNAGVITGTFAHVTNCTFTYCGAAIVPGKYALYIVNCLLSTGITGITNIIEDYCNYRYTLSGTCSAYIYSSWIDNMAEYGCYFQNFIGNIDGTFDHIGYSGIYIDSALQKVTIRGNYSRCGMYFAGLDENDDDDVLAELAQLPASENKARIAYLAQMSAISIRNGHNVDINVNAVSGYNEDSLADYRAVCPFTIFNFGIMENSTVATTNTRALQIGGTYTDCHFCFSVEHWDTVLVNPSGVYNLTALDTCKFSRSDLVCSGRTFEEVGTNNDVGVGLHVIPEGRMIGKLYFEDAITVNAQNYVFSNYRSRFKEDTGGVIIAANVGIVGYWRWVNSSHAFALTFTQALTGTKVWLG